MKARMGFTLVEILIVVIILGIMAAIVIPQFARASEEAAVQTTRYELEKVRRAIAVYQARNENALPDVEAGDRTWGVIVEHGEYLKDAPVNPWVGGANQGVIAIASAPDSAFQTSHGWVYNDQTGEVWAGSFDEQDDPLPKP